MQLQTFGAWSATIGSVGAGALTQSPEYSYLALPLAEVSGVVWLIVLAIFIYRNRNAIRRGAARLGSWYFIAPCLAVGLIALAGALYGIGLRAANPVTQANKVLTLEERQHRLNLKKFVLLHVAELNVNERVMTDDMMNRNIKKNGERANPVNNLASQAIGESVYAFFNVLKSSADVANIESIKVAETEGAIAKFFNGYAHSQNAILDYIKISDIRPDSGKLRAWLDADRKCFEALKELKISSSTDSIIRGISDSLAASNRASTWEQL